VGLTIWILDAHRDDGKRFVVHADEMLTAFIELESAIRAGIRWLHPGDLGVFSEARNGSFHRNSERAGSANPGSERKA